MLLDDIAVTNFALPLWANKGRVSEDNAFYALGHLTRDYGRGHASHRMAQL